MRRLLLIFGFIVGSCTLPLAAPIDDLQRSFMRPPDDARIMMRWWWFGPAVTKAELEREMQQMKAGGIGGFEVQPVYPLVLDDPEKGIKTSPFLSDGFIDALRFTSEKARELGLRFDLTLGSGWPFGGPMVTVDNASGKLRYEHVKIDPAAKFVKQPSIGAGEKLLAVFLARVEGAGFDPRSILELTNIKDGLVALPDHSAGPHEVLFFISSRSGMQVKRPAVGGEGFVLDHLNRVATDMYLKTVGDRLMQAFPTNPPHAVFCDSLEVYGADWSSDFLEEFQRRRGYDLKPHLPALVNDLGPETKALRRDWGLTLTELLNERFLAPMQQWSKQHRTLFRVQDYGVPAAALSSNAYADLPEGEGAQWKTLSATRWASSASHIYGRGVTSSETWTWLHSPSFRATPLDMKAEADRHFLMGINQLIGHGWPYTAPGVEYPGWRFYAAGAYSEQNPWWIVMPDLSGYLQRLSYLMRQGKPQNDVALYLPNADAYAGFSAGRVHLIDAERELVGEKVMPAIFEAGYNVDFFDDTILAGAKISPGVLSLGASDHRVVVLPGVERMPLGSLKKLDAFVKSGGIVVATGRLPSTVPGMQAADMEQAELKTIVTRLFTGSTPSVKFVPKEEDLGPVLNNLLQPDAAITPSGKDFGVVHRKTADADIYFVANTSNKTQNVQIAFRSSGKPEVWDAITGRFVGATVIKNAGSRTEISLDFEPYRSHVVVFTSQSSAPNAIAYSHTAASIDLNSDWSVAFGTQPPVQVAKLRSWADGEATRYFSGTASYERSIELSDEFLRSGKVIELDLGEPIELPVQPLRNGMQTWIDPPVREAAVIYVNGQRAGSLWSPPYRLDVTSLLRPGKNALRIVVGNTALNYMAGRKLPDYRLLNLRYGERFQPQDMDKIQVLPSGLTGSVSLRSVK